MITNNLSESQCMTIFNCLMHRYTNYIHVVHISMLDVIQKKSPIDKRHPEETGSHAITSLTAVA